MPLQHRMLATLWHRPIASLRRMQPVRRQLAPNLSTIHNGSPRSSQPRQLLGHSVMVILHLPFSACMNVNGVPAGQVSARELPDIRGQQLDPLPPGQVGGPQVQAEDVGAVHHRRSHSAPQSAGHQSAVTDDQPGGGFTWPHLGKPESQAIRDVYDLVGSPQNHFESPETGYPGYVRWVRAAA